MFRLCLCTCLVLWVGAVGLWKQHFSEIESLSAATINNSTSSHSLALTGDGGRLLVVNPDSATVTLVDTTSLSIIAEIPVGDAPISVAIAGDQAYVSNQGSDSISVIDLPTHSVKLTIMIGGRPAGLAVSPNGRFLAVAELGDDAIRLLDTVNLVTLTRHSVADRPYGLSFTPGGRYLLVSHLLSGTVTRLAVRPYRQLMPLVTRQPSTGNGQILSTTQPELPAPSSTAVVSDNLPVTEIDTWPNVAPAPSVVVNKAGTRAYLPQTMANGQGLNTQFDTTVFPKVSVINLELLQHQSAEHISLPETDRPVGLPWDVALTGKGTELWVVNAASNDISIVDISNPISPRRQAHIVVGDNPRGIVFSPDGNQAYVNNTLSGAVSVIDTGTYTVTAVVPVTDIPLPPLLLDGKRLFNSSARSELSRASWISCNSCHVEGEHDGRTWLLQFAGLVPSGTSSIGATPTITRNTTSLLGMIETYPLRWSAEWDESADSEFSIRFAQFGSGLIDGDMHPTLGPPNQGRSEELDSLAAYIDSLLPYPRSHSLHAAELRGRTIFESPRTECTTCHPAPLYTDLLTHDVGTAGGSGEWFGPKIDTPTLRFLNDSPPYLHDGSAATLMDVLTASNPDDKHGLTSHLADQELDDLVAFLLALPYGP